MIILGIDPGVATIGFGAIRADRGKNMLIRYGVITTPPGIPLSSRLLQISNDMEELIHTFHPDEMAVEELFFTKNITTGIAVAHGRGVILLAAEKLGVPVFEYTPMQVKQAVVGYGGAVIRCDSRLPVIVPHFFRNGKQRKFLSLSLFKISSDDPSSVGFTNRPCKSHIKMLRCK